MYKSLFQMAWMRGANSLPYQAKTFWQRIRRLAQQPTWWVEVSIALSLTLWAAFCIAERHSLTHKSFSLLLSFAPEFWWERMALGAGLFHIVALVMNGAHPLLHGYNWRVAASAFSAWFLSFMVINFLSAPVTPPGTAFYLVPLGFDLFAMYRNLRRTG